MPAEHTILISIRVKYEDYGGGHYIPMPLHALTDSTNHKYKNVDTGSFLSQSVGYCVAAFIFAISDCAQKTWLKIHFKTGEFYENSCSWGMRHSGTHSNS